MQLLSRPCLQQGVPQARHAGVHPSSLLQPLQGPCRLDRRLVLVAGRSVEPTEEGSRKAEQEEDKTTTPATSTISTQTDLTAENAIQPVEATTTASTDAIDAHSPSPRSPSPSPSDHSTQAYHVTDPAAAHTDISSTDDIAINAEEEVTATAARSSPQQLTSHPLQFTEQDEQDFFGTKELVQELKTGFGKRGEGWVFANLAALALVIFSPFRLQGLIDLLGTICFTAGIVFIVYAVLSLGRNISPVPAPRAKHELVTSGMYAYCSHPMYGGVILAAIGLICLTRSETRLALAALLFWTLDRKAKLEERLLAERYPDTYPAYLQSVKRFIPFLY